MKIVCRSFHVKTPFKFWDMRTWAWHMYNMWKLCLQTFRNNRTRSKLTHFLRSLQTSRPNYSRILRIKKVKFSGYCSYVNTNIKGDFPVYISVPLKIYGLIISKTMTNESFLTISLRDYEEPSQTSMMKLFSGS